MIAAQPVRHSRPARATELIVHRARNGEHSLLVDREVGVLRENGQEAVGVLGLDPGLDVHTQEHGQIAVGDAFEQLRLPAEPCGGHSEASDCVTGVVVAIAEGPLAVLPRFAPVDGREAHKDSTLRKLCRDLQPRFTRQLRSDLECVLERGVVVDRGLRMKTGDGSGDQVALGRMKITARGIDPERPTGAPGLLPGGEGERVLEELGDRDTVQRGLGDVDRARTRVRSAARAPPAGDREAAQRRLRSGGTDRVACPSPCTLERARTETDGASIRSWYASVMSNAEASTTITLRRAHPSS